MESKNFSKGVTGTPIKIDGLSERLNPGIGSRLQAMRKAIEIELNGTTARVQVENTRIVLPLRNPQQTSSFDSEVWERRMPTVNEFLFGQEFLGAEFAPTNVSSFRFFDPWQKHLNFVLDPSSHVSHVFAECGIGTGKTSFAAAAALYFVTRLMCLRDPQGYFGLTSSSPIVIFVASITMRLAEDVTLDRIRGMMGKSPFFQEFVKDPPEGDIALPKKVYIEFGSQPRHALGSNIFFAILDESNFGTSSSSQDDEHQGQIVDLYNQTFRRIDSRFIGPGGYVAGQLWAVSSRQTKSDALHRLIVKEKQSNLPTSYIIELSLWEAMGFKPGKPRGIYSGSVFRVLVGDQFTDPRILADEEVVPTGSEVVEVPIEHRDAFVRDTIGALRDIANIAMDPITRLIRMPWCLHDCVDDVRPLFFRKDTIALDLNGEDQISGFMDLELFRKYLASMPQDLEFSLHIDTATKGFLAIAMSHANKISAESIDRTGKPVKAEKTEYTNDFTIRIKGATEKGIPLSKIAEFVLFLRDEMGINFAAISADSYQNAAIVQPLAVSGIVVKNVSVDRTDGPYIFLQQVIYGRNLSLCKYQPLIIELLELNHFADKRKVDHPFGGTKDCADALCGSIWNLAQIAAANGQSSGPPIVILNRKQIEKQMRENARREEREDMDPSWDFLLPPVE